MIDYELARLLKNVDFKEETILKIIEERNKDENFTFTNEEVTFEKTKEQDITTFSIFDRRTGIDEKISILVFPKNGNITQRYGISGERNLDNSSFSFYVTNDEMIFYFKGDDEISFLRMKNLNEITNKKEVIYEKNGVNDSGVFDISISSVLPFSGKKTTFLYNGTDFNLNKVLSFTEVCSYSNSLWLNDDNYNYHNELVNFFNDYSYMLVFIKFHLRNFSSLLNRTMEKEHLKK